MDGDDFLSLFLFEIVFHSFVLYFRLRLHMQEQVLSNGFFLRTAAQVCQSQLLDDHHRTSFPKHQIVDCNNAVYRNT